MCFLTLFLREYVGTFAVNRLAPPPLFSPAPFWENPNFHKYTTAPFRGAGTPHSPGKGVGEEIPLRGTGEATRRSRQEDSK